MSRSESETLQLLNNLLEACKELEMLWDGIESRSQELSVKAA